MEVLYPRCGGLDIHKRLVVACRVTPGPDGQPVKQIRTFGAMTQDLLALADWLAEGGCAHVAMESTGVYWKPVFNLLEGDFVLLLVNARHVKATPADYSHRHHGFPGRDGRGHGSHPSALRAAPAAG